MNSLNDDMLISQKSNNVNKTLVLIKKNYVDAIDWILFTFVLAFMPIYIRLFINLIAVKGNTYIDYIPDISMTCLLATGYCLKESLQNNLWKDYKVLSMVILLISIASLVFNTIIYAVAFMQNIFSEIKVSHFNMFLFTCILAIIVITMGIITKIFIFKLKDEVK